MPTELHMAPDYMSEFEVLSVSFLFVNVYNSINAALKLVHVCTFYTDIVY